MSDSILSDIIDAINSTIDYAHEHEDDPGAIREYAHNAASGVVNGEQPQQQQQLIQPSYQSPSASYYDIQQSQYNPANGQGSVIVDLDQLAANENAPDSKFTPDQDRVLNPIIEKVSGKADEVRGSYEGSPQQLEDIERRFQEEQDNSLNTAKSFDTMNALNMYGQLGVDPNDPMVKSALSNIANGQVSDFSRDQTRRFTDGNGNVKSPLDWNLLGFTSQNKTPDAARNLYDFHFREEDASGEQKEQIDRGNVIDKNAIDDGRSPGSREALFMTGEQYIKYRNEFGIPGRDVNKIDPDEIYSKQDEQDKYGFIPYITSEESLDRFHDQAAPHAVSNVFNHLSNLRRENTDFTVNFDDKQISGKDLIQNGNLWWKRNAGKESEVVTDPKQVTDTSVPYTYALTDPDGNVFTAKSPLAASYIDEQGRPVMRFEDGETWTFDDEADVQRSLSERVAQDGDYSVYWKNIEPLVLDDGTVLRADKAEQLLSNNNYQNFADYGDMNFNKPVVEDPFEEGAFLPWITDVALGSVPFFFKPTAAAQGIGNAMGSVTGFEPGYQDYLNGTYSMLSDVPTREEQVTSTLGSLALPVTEHLWGNLGSSMLTKPFLKAIGKEAADINPLVRYGMGTVGEGLEEIPGNIVEEFQNNGLSKWYGNEMYRDADGNLTTEDTGVKAYDNQGNLIKDPNTDMTSRVSNFIGDIPLAFLGGVTLGGTLGAPSIKGYYNEYMPRNQERMEFGDNLINPGYDQSLVVPLTDEERERYNR